MPQRTVALLNQLRAYGFTDDDFRIVHHNGQIASIVSHMGYCEGRNHFSDSHPTNAQVRDRLELVLASYRAGDFVRPARPGVFRALAAAAVAEIPMLSGPQAST